MKLKAIIMTAAFLTPCAFAQHSGKSGHGIEFLPAERLAPVGKATSDRQLTTERENAKFGGFAQEKTQPEGWDLLKYSDFLGKDGKYVILPKNSVIYVPESLEATRLASPEGRMIPWMEFLRNHRSIISTLDVTMDQVYGKKPLPPETLEMAAKNKLIVIAVYNGNPITVIKAPDPATAQNTTTPPLQ